MPSTQVRSGIRKKSSLSKELFTIHEELPCISPYFRNILQPRRKTLEGECSICHGTLDPNVKELTYCSTSCGNNFHQTCIEQWHDSPTHGETSKCPLCRQAWETAQSSGIVHDVPTLDPEAFKVYAEWLYKSTISILFDYESLIQAYTLGELLGDKMFLREVLSAIMARSLHANKLPSGSYVKDAFDGTSADSPLRKLPVVMYVNSPADVLQARLASCSVLPPAFTRELIVVLARRRVRPLTTLEDKEARDKVLDKLLL